MKKDKNGADNNGADNNGARPHFHGTGAEKRDRLLFFKMLNR